MSHLCTDEEFFKKLPFTPQGTYFIYLKELNNHVLVLLSFNDPNNYDYPMISTNFANLVGHECIIEK